jgi:hypothetical protein
VAPGFRVLNIFNMRSVMRNPLTRLVVDAVTAIKPRVRLNVLACAAPVIRIEPTTAMAEMAFVSDIRGVWSSGETRRITSRPRNVASMRMYRPTSRSVSIRFTSSG